jgi:hypothetical protein
MILMVRLRKTAISSEGVKAQAISKILPKYCAMMALNLCRKKFVEFENL